MAITPFDGIARKVVLPLIALSAVGWLVYVIGFGLLKQGQAAVPQQYPYYAAAVIGPFVYIGAVAQAALWRQISSIVGSIIAILSVVYFTAMGFILHFTGIAIYAQYNRPETFPLDNNINVVFSGSFLACLFWKAVLSIAYFTAMGTILHGSGTAINRYYNFSNESLSSSMEILFTGSFLACFFWAGVLAMWPWYTTGAPTHGQSQQSALISMDETLERGTYEPTDSPQ